MIVFPVRGIAALLVSACAVAPSAAAAPATPDDIPRILLSVDEVRTAVGAPVAMDNPSAEPYQDFETDTPGCVAAADIGLPSEFGGDGLSGFRISLMRDKPEKGGYFVKQVVGVFDSAAEAAAVQSKAVSAVQQCFKLGTPIEMTFPAGGSDPEHWAFKGLVAGPQTTWHKDETQEANWQCDFASEAHGNLVLQAKVCEYAPTGAPLGKLIGAMQSRAAALS
ncbi:MAG: sensor domain-containing protein [Segniliparus sp.]|uniref:sensor domain-containing protein n=1 Tax=Segniliparus sp. TaxID=2804064 RepID=UPI003F41590C